MLAERRANVRPAPELVWTGPERTNATARETAVVLRALFEGARQSVILAGYSFSHGHDVLRALHASMRDHGVQAIFFVHIQQVDRRLANPESHAVLELRAFLNDNWLFGAPFPRLYYDKRALEPGPPYCSLHAKCVVVDGARAFVSNANFTERGQERNIEVGVLIDDPQFAYHLASQWVGLIQNGIAQEARILGDLMFTSPTMRHRGAARHRPP